MECLIQGRADLALGMTPTNTSAAGLQVQDLGDVQFAFAVAPFHPLAQHEGPITDEVMREHRLVVISDSAQRERTSMGLLDGQDIFTVDHIQAKIDAQVRGLGCGFLSQAMVQPYVDAGLLVIKPVARAARNVRVRYAWKKSGGGGSGQGLAMVAGTIAKPGDPAGFAGAAPLQLVATALIFRFPHDSFLALSLPWALCTIAHRPLARRLAGRGSGQLAGRPCAPRHLAGAHRRH